MLRKALSRPSFWIETPKKRFSTSSSFLSNQPFQFTESYSTGASLFHSINSVENIPVLTFFKNNGFSSFKSTVYSCMQVYSSGNHSDNEQLIRVESDCFDYGNVFVSANCNASHQYHSSLFNRRFMANDSNCSEKNHQPMI